MVDEEDGEAICLYFKIAFVMGQSFISRLKIDGPLDWCLRNAAQRVPGESRWMEMKRSRLMIAHCKSFELLGSGMTSNFKEISLKFQSDSEGIDLKRGEVDNSGPTGLTMTCLGGGACEWSVSVSDVVGKSLRVVEVVVVRRH